MSTGFFDLSHSSRKERISRHLLTLFLAIVLNWLIWFTLSHPYYIKLADADRLPEFLTDLWTTALETIILFEAALIYSRWIISALWDNKHTFGMLVLQCLTLLVANFLSSTVIAWFYAWIDPDMASSSYRHRIILSDSITVYFATSIFFMSYLINRHREESEKVLLAERNELKSQNKIMRSQLEKLSLTMDNHFVFNSLSTLSGLIPTAPDLALDFLDRFSRIYRYLVNAAKKRVVPLEKELDFTRDYIRMATIRYPGINFCIDPSCRSAHCLVSPVSVQALVENAIRHNRHGGKDGLRIKVFVDGQEICVENNLLPRPDDYPSTHTGLDNLNDRYKLLINLGIHVENGPGFFRVRIPMIDLDYEDIDY